VGEEDFLMATTTVYTMKIRITCKDTPSMPFEFDAVVVSYTDTLAVQREAEKLGGRVQSMSQQVSTAGELIKCMRAMREG
jgi:hypothetical protein